MGKLTVVVDNRAERGLRAAWGLSILVESEEERILFDAGPDSSVLRHNMEKLSIPENVNYLVISHNHWDHVGGITYAAKFSNHLCLPENIGIEGEICKGSTSIDSFAITTGTMGHILKEQALIVRGRKTTLLVGCSHPGIENIVERARKIAGEVNIVIGGFHLMDSDERRLNKIVKTFEESGVEEVYGIHCTGERARKFFLDRMGERAKSGYVGLVIEF